MPVRVYTQNARVRAYVCVSSHMMHHTLEKREKQIRTMSRSLTKNYVVAWSPNAWNVLLVAAFVCVRNGRVRIHAHRATQESAESTQNT